MIGGGLVTEINNIYKMYQLAKLDSFKILSAYLKFKLLSKPF